MGISSKQALDCFESDDLIGLGMEADRVRRRLHPEGVVTYTVQSELDCTNLTAVSKDALCAESAVAVDMGATSLALRASTQTKLNDLEDLIAVLKQRLPGIWLDLIAANDLPTIAASTSLSLDTTALSLEAVTERLRASGLDSLSGSAFASEAAAKNSAWLVTHRAAHRAGLTTSAQLIFGSGESPIQRVAILEAVRSLQDETAGFTEFTPLGFVPPSGRELDGSTAVEALRTLAIARMLLENVPNVQMSPVSGSLKVRQTGLRFGANDAGAVLLTSAAKSTEEDLRRIIRDAGFRPVQRDTPYRTVF